MEEMPFRPILLGGLVAGTVIGADELVLNQLIFGADWEEALYRLSPETTSRGDDPRFWDLAFSVGLMLGISLLWIYVCIRSRFGPGYRTGFLAAVTVVVVSMAGAELQFGRLSYLYAFADMQMRPSSLWMLGVVEEPWRILELSIAAFAGARVFEKLEFRGSARAEKSD